MKRMRWIAAAVLIVAMMLFAACSDRGELNDGTLNNGNGNNGTTGGAMDGYGDSDRNNDGLLDDELTMG